MFDLPDGLLLQQLPFKYLAAIAAAPVDHIIDLIGKATKEELDAIAERDRKEGFDVTVSY